MNLKVLFRRIMMLCMCYICSIIAVADDDYNNFLKSALQEYDDFLSSAQKEYIDWLSKPWEEVKTSVIDQIKDHTTPPKPIVKPEDDHDDEETVIDDDNVVIPDPTPIPKPKPIDIPKPIEEDKPKPKPEETRPNPQPTVQKHKFVYLGNNLEVRFSPLDKIHLANISENGVSDAWRQLSTAAMTNLISDCLSIRSRYKMCDWAYIQMLDRLSKSVYGNTNEGVVFMAYIYSRSGYKMRLARGTDNNLHLMYASRHKIYNTRYFPTDDNYYVWGGYSGSIYISNAGYHGEQPLSLIIDELPVTGDKISSPRRRQAKNFSDMDFNVVANENLIEFYGTYPSSEIDDNPMTRWAMLANATASRELKDRLYPLINRQIAGLPTRQKVNKILNWVQTSLIYEYDDKVWGHDRAFFPDESLYYPYADCEDRAILFTRLVRDLVGLKAALIFVPGHLLAAVKFDDQQGGDCIYVNNVKYIICEPTFVNGGPVGLKGNYDLKQSRVIILK